MWSSQAQITVDGGRRIITYVGAALCRGVGRLVRTDLKLMTRDPLVLTFAFAFSVVTMLVIGGAFSTALEPGPAGANPDVPAGGCPALTTFDDDEVLAGVLRVGAAGFILKGVPAEDLHRAVRVIAGGGAWLDPAVTGRVLATYRSAPPPRAGRDPALDALTSREREVLALIGQGKTNTEIAVGLFSATERSRRTSTTCSPSCSSATVPPRSSSPSTMPSSPRDKTARATGPAAASDRGLATPHPIAGSRQPACRSLCTQGGDNACRRRALTRSSAFPG